MLRLLNCHLMIDLYVKHEEYPSPIGLHIFKDYGVHVHDLDDLYRDFGDLAVQLNKTPYVTKLLSLLSASCEECIFMDADTVAVRDPAALFNDPLYKDTGLLLWPDLWHMRAGKSPLRQIFAVPESTDADVRTVDTGQMVVNKKRAWPALVLALYMQLQPHFFVPLAQALHPQGGPYRVFYC